MIKQALKFGNRQIYALNTVYQYGLFNKQQEQRQLSAKKKKPAIRKQTLDNVKFDQKGIQRINAANQHFQGIRMNTKYAKFYNQDTLAKIDSFSGRKLSDLPFQPKERVIHVKQSQDKQDQMKNERLPKKQTQKVKKGQRKQKKQNVKQQEVIKKSKLCQHIIGQADQKKLIQVLKTVSQKYFTDLVNKERTIKIEPNFERQARRVIQSLKKEGYEFKLTKNQKVNFRILNAQLFKGLEVTRNNNYSIDSYQILKQEGYTYYKLWQKGAYKIPQQQWFTQSKLLLRITAEVSSPFNVEMIKNNKTEIKTQRKAHVFVFETDLKKPPKYSQFRLPPPQYLKQYKINLDDFVITNVDNRNPYAAFTFQQTDKKAKLINKLV